MNDNELTSGLKDFFAEPAQTASGRGRHIGTVGAVILHLVVFTFAVYSGYHGISATARYHAANGLGLFAGIVGIVGIEFVLIGLYLAFFYRRIIGESQQLAAAATAGLGFILSCLGIIADSQLQAGLTLSPWLAAYIIWGLPIAPAFMALGAAVVMALEPKHLRGMRESGKQEEFEEKKHTSRMAAKTAELGAAQTLANIQLNARTDAALTLLAAYRSPEVQAHLRQSALANMPEIMRAVGVHLPYGTVVEGQVIQQQPDHAADHPEPTADEPARPSWLDRLRDRLRDRPHDAPQPVHDATRQEQPAAGPSAPTPDELAEALALIRARQHAAESVNGTAPAGGNGSRPQ